MLHTLLSVLVSDFVLVSAAACFFSSLLTSGVSLDRTDFSSMLLSDCVDVTKLMADIELDGAVTVTIGLDVCSGHDGVVIRLKRMVTLNGNNLTFMK